MDVNKAAQAGKLDELKLVNPQLRYKKDFDGEVAVFVQDQNDFFLRADLDGHQAKRKRTAAPDPCFSMVTPVMVSACPSSVTSSISAAKPSELTSSGLVPSTVKTRFQLDLKSGTLKEAVHQTEQS